MVERIELESVTIELTDAAMIIEPTGEIEGTMHDVLEELVTDHGFEWIAPEEIGALTDADIIGRGVVRDDDGEILSIDDIFWDMDYAVVDSVGRLARGEQALLVRQPTREEAEFDYAATLLRRINNIKSDFIVSVNPWGIQVKIDEVLNWPWEPTLISELGEYETVHFRCERAGVEAIGVIEADRYESSGIRINGMSYVDALIELKS